MKILPLKSKFEAIAVRGTPAPVVGAEAGAPVPLVNETPHATKGIDLDVTVSAERVVEAVKILDEANWMLEAITGVDWLAERQFEVVYDFTHVDSGERVTVRVRISRDKPELPTISHIYGGANWHERETHDFFGIIFLGHPQLIPLLLPEDARFHPLRKDFTA
ncbi:MAG: NADH-quinone oxidoreductase subunit C [bacterium]